MLKLSFTLASLVLLSACSTLPGSKSDFTPQATRVDQSHQPFVSGQWQSGVASDQASASAIDQDQLADQLLNLVNDPELSKLVQLALAQNQDLQLSALRLRQSRLQLGVARAGDKPTVDLSFSSQRANQPVTSTTHNLSLNMAWELDVWGRLADASSAAERESEALQQDLAAARNSLVGRVVQRWIDISVRAQVIQAEQQRIDSLNSTLEVITDRYRDGIGSLADLEAARTTSAQTKATIAARKQEQAEAIQQLNLLLGQSSTKALVLPVSIPEITSPPAILPASVIAARPDLQAAYQRIVAADKNTAVAEKNLLPGFNLTASLGQSDSDLGDLLSASTGWSLLGSLTAPLFNSGRLKAEAEIQSLQAEQAYLSYQQTLLTALQEVEAALGQENALAAQQGYLQQALTHSQASLSYYRSRYRDGLADILDLLNTEQTAFDARIQLLTVQQTRLTNRIALGLALGMGV